MSEPPHKKSKLSSQAEPVPAMDVDDSATPSSNEAGQAEYDDDNLFPESGNVANTSAVRPQTPQNDHLNASEPSQLSPPRSQPPSQRPSVPNGDHSFEFDGPASFMGGADTGSNQDDKPGASYKNKKAQEEMQRAWEYIVDKDFSLREYGDVVMIGKQQRGEA